MGDFFLWLFFIFFYPVDGARGERTCRKKGQFSFFYSFTNGSLLCARDAVHPQFASLCSFVAFSCSTHSCVSGFSFLFRSTSQSCESGEKNAKRERKKKKGGVHCSLVRKLIAVELLISITRRVILFSLCCLFPELVGAVEDQRRLQFLL